MNYKRTGKYKIVKAGFVRAHDKPAVRRRIGKSKITKADLPAHTGNVLADSGQENIKL